MTTIRYDTKYCPDAPYIYYHMLDDGYMVGGEYETLEEAATTRADIIKKHGECKWEERMGKPENRT
jgi:hypothetical protein